MLHARYILLVLFMLTPGTQAETIFSLKGLQQSGSSFFNTLKRNKLATTLALSGAAALWMAYYRPHYFSTDYWKNYWSGAGGQQPTVSAQEQSPVAGGGGVAVASSLQTPQTAGYEGLQSSAGQRTTLSPVGSGPAPLAQEAGKAEGSKTVVGSKEEEKEEVIAPQSNPSHKRPTYQPAKIIAKQKEAAPAETFKNLVAKSDSFFRNQPITEFNKIKHIAGDDQAKQETVLKHAMNVRPIMHKEVEGLMNAFLHYKQDHGSAKEQEFYKGMQIGQFINRLLTQRPLAFFGHSDTYLLRDRKTRGNGGFELIGTDQKKSPVPLKDYLSYDEMAIAALLGVSVPTYFINKGDRYNMGEKGAEGTFQETGIYVGLVGARFEKPGLMEYSHMLISSVQNTPDNGYGDPSKEDVNKEKSGLLGLWAKFYNEPYFKTYDEVKQEVQQKGQVRYASIGNRFLDKEIYKKRLKKVLEPFFHDANRRGQEYGQQAYCHMVGLGIGVWAVNNLIQEKIFFDTCVEILSQSKFPHISDVDFSHFDTLDKRLNGRHLKNGINLYISERNPADPLVDANKLLVAMYAWDGNAYPGNEYWVKMLDASGDPAAACCSTITELQNPLINGNVSHKTLQKYP